MDTCARIAHVLFSYFRWFAIIELSTVHEISPIPGLSKHTKRGQNQQRTRANVAEKYKPCLYLPQRPRKYVTRYGRGITFLGRNRWALSGRTSRKCGGELERVRLAPMVGDRRRKKRAKRSWRTENYRENRRALVERGRWVVFPWESPSRRTRGWRNIRSLPVQPALTLSAKAQSRSWPFISSAGSPADLARPGSYTRFISRHIHGEYEKQAGTAERESALPHHLDIRKTAARARWCA